MKPVENEIKKWKGRILKACSTNRHSPPRSPSGTLQNLKRYLFWTLLVFFFSGSFLFCGNVWRFFSEILGKWSKFLWWKRGYCCVLSDFLILYTTAATSSLSVYSHHLQRASFCRFHPAASLFISATLTLTSPSVFSLLLFYVRPPPHRWSLVFHAVPLLCVQLF